MRAQHAPLDPKPLKAMGNERPHVLHDEVAQASTARVDQSAEFGVVIIGRNEGDRLRRCVQSVHSISATRVYVDSGSTDNSVEMARAMGVEVVTLDMNLPFTAARARNAGFHRLLTIARDLRYVQFIDGDCEIIDGWLQRATAFLNEQPGVAIVCGRLRERFPERSIYNRLCDMEWDRPPGRPRRAAG